MEVTVRHPLGVASASENNVTRRHRPDLPCVVIATGCQNLLSGVKRHTDVKKTKQKLFLYCQQCKLTTIGFSLCVEHTNKQSQVILLF